MSLTYVAVDIETTGLQAGFDQMIEIGAVKVVDGTITDTFECLIKQNAPLPQAVVELTGITDDDLMSGEELSAVLPAFLKFIDGFELVMHNARFDQAFLSRSLEDTGYLPLPNALLDTLELAQVAFPREVSYSLQNLSQSLGISHIRPHRALSDATAAHELFVKSLSALANLSEAVLSLLYQTAQISGWPMAHLIGELLANPGPDRAVVEEGCTIIQGLAHRLVEWQSFDEKRELTGSPRDIIGSHGPLAVLHPHYEERPAQLQMMEQVAQAFEEDSHLLVEAGTGTGKSLAYLIPALYHAVKSGQKVVVATHTLHLQEQLRERDIPLLKKSLPFPFEASILKGRNNYVCMRKVSDGLLNLGMLPEETERLFYLKMITWLVQTDSGDREELQMLGSQTDTWNKVQSDSNSCIARACPFFKNCYYFRARGAAQASDVIITNHSLVLTDVKSGSQILPDYEYLVIDEAHHLEDEATKHLGDEVSYWSMINPLNRLARDRKTGLLGGLAHFAQIDQSSGNQMFTGLYELSVSASESVQELRDAVENFFTSLGEFVKRHAPDSAAGRLTLRFKPEHAQLSGWEELLNLADQLEQSLLGLREKMNRMETFGEILGAEQTIQGLITDSIGQVKELDRGWSSIAAFLSRAEDPANSVLWVEADERMGRLVAVMYSAPLNVGELLRDALFDSKSSVVLTSATLTINHSFDYAIDRLGLRETAAEDGVLTLEVDSPFDYKKQSIVCIPTDTVPLKGASSPDFVAALSKSIVTLARITNGRMLVLFTSHKMLRETAELTEPKLTEHGITLLAQGLTDGSRFKLVAEFQKLPKAVLFGANSFWEGVDIPGEDLSCLVIVRLPFSPPNQPVVEARTESLERDGKNAFLEYSVPQAVVRFKQGFGRVIRSKRDIGAVVVYDRRVIDSRYGRLFLESLPNPWIYQGPEQDVLKIVYNWLKKDKPM